MFDIDDAKFPRTWAEFSFDYKLVFINHGAMMLMMLLSSVLTTRSLLILILLWDAVLIQRSLAHRRARQWAWPGVVMKDLVGGLASLLLGGFFLGSILMNFTSDGPAIYPIIGACAGLVLTGVLQSVNLLAASEKEFTACCEGRRPERVAVDPMPDWKGRVRAILTACFIVGWICGVGSFWVHGLAMRRSSALATAEAPIAYVEHGKTVYISRNLDRARSALETAAGIGMPIVIVSCLFAHFVLGVKMFPHAKSFADVWKEKPWNRKA